MFFEGESLNLINVFFIRPPNRGKSVRIFQVLALMRDLIEIINLRAVSSQRTNNPHLGYL